MGDNLGVRFGGEDVPPGGELLAQLAEILDDAVMDHRDAVAGMGMGVVLGRLAVGRPAGVANADTAG